MVDEVEEKSAIDNDDVLSRFGKALQFGLDQPLERIADTFKVFGFTDTEKFLRDLTEEPENYISAAEKFMQGNGINYGWEYLPRAIVEQIGSLAGNVATRVAGAGIGGAVAGPGGAVAGAFAAPVLFEALQILGPTAYERARNEGREQPTLEDWMAIAPTTAISSFLGSLGAQNIARLNSISKFGIPGNMSRTTRGVLEEGLTEGAQSLVEQTGTTAFTKNGYEVNLRDALGEGIIGAGTGGGTNAIFDIAGGVSKLRNFEPQDAQFKDENTNITGVELIKGQPKYKDLKRQKNVFRGSGVDYDVSRTDTESPIDYLNRLDRELGLGGGNLTREDLIPTTPAQLAFNLGLITNVNPFENPLESLSNEQQESLNNALDEQYANNKVVKINKALEDLNYLSDYQRATIAVAIQNAVEEAQQVAGLYPNLDITQALPTGTRAGKEILSTGNITALRDLPPITNITNHTDYRELQRAVEENQNLTPIEAQLVLAKQTWAKDKSYSGLETDLNLTYYEDKTGQRYQRTPEEQAVIIEGINDYFNYSFLSDKYSPETGTRNLGLVLNSEFDVDNPDYVHVERRLTPVLNKVLQKYVDRGTAELEFNRIANTFPVATTFKNNYADLDLRRQELGSKAKDFITQLNDYFGNLIITENIEDAGYGSDIEIARVKKISDYPEFYTMGGLFSSTSSPETQPLYIRQLFKKNRQNQELIAQIYTEAFNPLADQSFMRYTMDLKTLQGVFNDSTTGIDTYKFLNARVNYFSLPREPEGTSFNKLQEALRQEVINAFDNYVTNPAIRESAEKIITDNFNKAKYFRTRNEIQKNFDEAFIKTYFDDAEMENVVNTELNEIIDSALQEVATTNPQLAQELQNKANEILNNEDLDVISGILNSVKYSTKRYMEEHPAEFRGSPEDGPVPPEVVKERIQAIVQNEVSGSRPFTKNFGFLTNAIKQLALKERYEPNAGVKIGRDQDVSKPDYWQFLERTSPELFQVVDRLGLQEYGDVMAEVAIKEAGNRPFATPVNPVFMSTYFINENIQKLVPGRPYDSKEMLKFLVTPHKQEKPIYPTDSGGKEIPVLGRDGQPVLDEQGQPRTRTQRKSEDRSLTARELFGANNNPDINQDFYNEARKEIVDTNIANLLIQRAADNRPVTKEELELLLNNDANKTLMTVSRKSTGPRNINAGMLYETGHNVDPVLSELADDYYTIHLFNDYSKSKNETVKQMSMTDSYDLGRMNDKYADKSQSGTNRNQYKMGGHPPGRFWSRHYEIVANVGELMLRDYQTQQPIDDVTGIKTLNESQNDSEYFRGENVNRLTEATFPIMLNKVKESLKKLLPNESPADIDEIVDGINSQRAGIEEYRDADAQLEDYVIEKFREKRGLGATTPTPEQKIVLREIDTFLDDVIDVAHLGQVYGDVEPDGIRTNMDKLNKFLDFTQMGGFNEIFPNAHELSDADIDTRILGKKYISLREDVDLTPSNLIHTRISRSKSIDDLMNMYGAALTLSPDNLKGLRETIGLVQVIDNDETGSSYRDIDFNFIENIYGWLTNNQNLTGADLSMEKDNNSAAKNFLFHAMILDTIQGNRPLLREDADDFFNRINREKDLPPYKFLKSVLPSPELNRDNPQEVEKEAKRIWGNWVKAVKDFENYTPAIPLLAALKNDPFYKSITKVDELDQMDKTFDDVKEVVSNTTQSTFETPYVGIGQNELGSTPMREGLGQSYTKKSVRMMLKEAIELGDPNVSHILVPTRYVNEKYGQIMGAHENFDRARNELQNIAEQNGVELRIVNYGEGTPDNFSPSSSQIERVAEKYSRSIKEDLINRFLESDLEFNIANNNLNGIRTGYLLPLEPFRVRDDSTPSGFKMKTVFRGMKLGGFVGKGIVGLRDEIYNSPLSKYVT
tara:strand:- start:4447 stop:10107 length:5661 start_codon:yes stop_codon:yes gene_type:complete